MRVLDKGFIFHIGEYPKVILNPIKAYLFSTYWGLPMQTVAVRDYGHWKLVEGYPKAIIID